jgi:flavin-binding protein dodecin
MSVLKVIEVLGNSTVSFDDAVKNVVTEVSKTVKNIKSVYVKDMEAKVTNNQVAQYRITAKVSFAIID